MPIGQLPAEQRQALADQWGYKTIGAELPDGVTLTDIVKSMPPEVRQHLAAGDGRHISCLSSLALHNPQRACCSL